MAVRTVDINRKAYERSWGEAAALLDERLSHPDATIGDALGVVDAWLCDAQVGADAFRVFADGREAPEGPAGGPYGQCIGTYGRYQFIPPGLVNRVLPQIILNRLPENIDTVVEFGSGLGQNLVYAALASGRRDLRYVGCELTEAGRSVTAKMAALMPGYSIETHAFDYTDWDLSFLNGDERVLAFTHFSIEQVTEIDSRFFHDLLKATASVEALHLEGCNWQRNTKLRATYDHYRTADVLPNHNIVARDDQFDLNCAFWAVRHAYNCNFLEVLDGLKREGLIDILELVPDFFGTNPFYPGSLVHWRGKDRQGD